MMKKSNQQKQQQHDDDDQFFIAIRNDHIVFRIECKRFDFYFWKMMC